MDRTTLLERLRQGEREDFEVKSARRGVPDDAYRTVAAFANTTGGWLIFGVRETAAGFQPVGVENAEQVHLDFVSACRAGGRLSRSVDLESWHHVLDDRAVLAFRVDQASRFDKPVRVRERGQWVAYVRRASGDHRCTEEEEARFIRDAALETYDSLVLDGTSLVDLDGDALRWMRGRLLLLGSPQALPEKDDAAFLRALGLVGRDGSLTRAAALLFGEAHVLTAQKPAGVVDYRVHLADWTGDAAAERWDDREVCERNLIATFKTLHERLARLVPSPFALETDAVTRRGEPGDLVALREACVNLLIHQDYSDHHRTARILWFRDRVVLDNPGDSWAPVSRLFEGGASELRNPLIARVFRLMGLAEQVGSGLRVLAETWRAAGRPAPRVLDDKAAKVFRLEIEFGGVSGGVNGGVNGGVSDSVTDRLQTVIGAAPGLRVPALATTLNVSRRTVERALAELVREGLVTFQGAPRTGGYHATGTTPAPYPVADPAAGSFKKRKR